MHGSAFEVAWEWGSPFRSSPLESPNAKFVDGLSSQKTIPNVWELLLSGLFPYFLFPY